MNYPIYKVTYLSCGVVQHLMLVPQHIYENFRTANQAKKDKEGFKALPDHIRASVLTTLDELSWFGERSKKGTFCTDQSAIGKAILDGTGSFMLDGRGPYKFSFEMVEDVVDAPNLDEESE